MAGTETKRIIELTEASTIQNGDFIAVDSNARGTKKVSTDALATSAALTAETNARAGADEQMSERMDGIEEQTALIQNPTKTLSGALVSFTDGADMPMVACTAEIVPKQSGTGTPSPDNVRQISGWESVNLYKSGKNLLKVNSVNAIGKGITQTLNEDGTITLSGTSTGLNNGQAINGSALFKLPVGTYRFVDVGETSGATFYYYLRVSGNSAWIRSGETFTVPEGSNGCWIVLYFPTNAELSGTHGLMIVNENDTYDTYEPYNGTTTTTDLGRTVYGGTVDIVSGLLTVDKAMVTVSNLTKAGSLQTGTYTCCQRYDLSPVANTVSISQKHGAISNMGVEDNAYYGAPRPNESGSSDVDYAIGTVGSILTVYDTDLTLTEATFADKYGSMQIAYPLAQPQTYQLTPTEVNTLLGENNVWADSGDVEITYRRDISIVLENLENALSGSNSLNAMMMSAPTENTAEEPTGNEAEDDMR